MTANMYITVQFTDGKIGRRRDARPLQTVIDADDPDWADTLCAEVHRHASNYLMSRDVDAALCEWTGATPPPGTRRLEGPRIRRRHPNRRPLVHHRPPPQRHQPRKDKPMTPHDLLPLPLGTIVLVTAANAFDVPIGTLATVAGHVRPGTTDDDTMTGWPIIAYQDTSPDPLAISAESWAIEPAAITVTNPPPSGLLTAISPEVAAHVLWHYQGTGYRPGNYTRNLIATLASADPNNLRILAHSVPDYAEAVRLAAWTPDGTHQLERILRSNP